MPECVVSEEDVITCLQRFYRQVDAKKNVDIDKLEQYLTPPKLLAEIAFWARQFLEGRVILDFGCGVGGFAISSLLLGARWAVGFDIDPLMVEKARSFKFLKTPTYAHWIVSAVEFLPLKASISRNETTVMMNPPFGSKGHRGIDRAFLLKAFEIGGTVISLHRYNRQSLKVFQKDAHVRGWKIVNSKKCYFPLDPTSRHQRSTKMRVMVLVFERTQKTAR